MTKHGDGDTYLNIVMLGCYLTVIILPWASDKKDPLHTVSHKYKFFVLWDLMILSKQNLSFRVQDQSPCLGPVSLARGPAELKGCAASLLVLETEV